MSRPVERWLLPAGAGAILVGLWYALTQIFKLEAYVLPTPDEIIRAAWKERRTLTLAALITGQGAILGFLAAVAAGFLSSVVMAVSSPLKRALYPYILMLHLTPVIILAPIFVLWLGQGLPSIVAITFMIGFFPIVANTMLGFVSTDMGLQELFALCKASRRQEIFFLRVPAAMPYFLTGVKIAGTLAPIGAITGDFLAGSADDGVGGLGCMAIADFAQLKIPELFATGAAACGLGFIFVGGVNLAYWSILRRWHESAMRPEQGSELAGQFAD
jgi:NitT/TauT family transport system permease protein